MTRGLSPEVSQALSRFRMEVDRLNGLTAFEWTATNADALKVLAADQIARVNVAAGVIEDALRRRPEAKPEPDYLVEK